MSRICPFCDSKVVKKNHNGSTFQCVYCRHIFTEADMTKHLKKQADITSCVTPEKGESTRSM